MTEHLTADKNNKITIHTRGGGGGRRRRWLYNLSKERSIKIEDMDVAHYMRVTFR